jgi:hypothetical protein
VQCLQKLRDHVGRPIRITSGYRPYLYNQRLYTQVYKKKPTMSRHSSGQAADISIAGMDGMQIAKAAIDACGPAIAVGIAGTYAHVDVRGSWARWTYFGPGTANDRSAIAEIDAYRNRLLHSASPAQPAPRPPTNPVAVGGPDAKDFARSTPVHDRYAALLPLLDRHRGDIPVDFLLGWIDVESNGRIDEVTKSLDERGFFQIHPAESKDHHFQHQRLTVDPDYSVWAGVQLVRDYATLARKRFPWIQVGSRLFWSVVKLQHAMGSGLARTMLAEMSRRGIPPITWQAIKDFELTDDAKRLHRLLRTDPGRFARNVARVFARGRAIASSFGR